MRRSLGCPRGRQIQMMSWLVGHAGLAVADAAGSVAQSGRDASRVSEPVEVELLTLSLANSVISLRARLLRGSPAITAARSSGPVVIISVI